RRALRMRSAADVLGNTPARCGGPPHARHPRSRGQRPRRTWRPRIASMKTRLLQADAPGAVEEAAAELTRGGLVAFPTDTVYGLAAGPDPLRQLYVAKERPKEKRITILLSDASNLEASALVSPAARALAEKFWPGPLTLVLVAPRRGTIAFRVPDHPVARRLVAAGGGGGPGTGAYRWGDSGAGAARGVMGAVSRGGRGGRSRR